VSSQEGSTNVNGLARRTTVALGLASLLASLLAVSATAAPARVAAQAATTVRVTAGQPMELRFTLSRRTVPRGTVVFNVRNRGGSDHDFKIKGKKTRMLASGESATLRVTFSRAGSYPFLCTVPGHAAAGMKGRLTVR